MGAQIHGHVSTIAVSFRGATLSADAFTGDPVVYVDDVADFGEEGGSLAFTDGSGAFLSPVDYTAIDDDDDSITLAATLAYDVNDGDMIRVVDADGNYVQDVIATVIDDADGGELQVEVEHALIRLLTESVRAGVSEAVTCTRDEHGVWMVTNVEGKKPTVAPYDRRSRATNVTIHDSTDTVLGWDTSTGKRGGMSMTSGVWTVPYDGRYPITASTKWDSASTTGQRRMWFRVNGVASGTEARVDAASSGGTNLCISEVLDLEAGDTVAVMVRQNSGADLDLLPGTNATITGLD